MKIEKLEYLNENHAFNGNITLVFKTPKNRENPYIIINHKIIADKRLDATEKGILLNILDNNENYYFRKYLEYEKSKVDIATFDKALNHLIELNYIVYTEINNTECWVINECPDTSIITNENIENTKTKFIESNIDDKNVIENCNYNIIDQLIKLYKENDELIIRSKIDYFKTK